MSLGSLAATSNVPKRNTAGKSLGDVVFMPYPYGFMNSFDTIGYIEEVLKDDHSGISKPAAIIFETVQAEGGIVVAPVKWIQKLRELCDKYEILLICDEIQVGCGRTGPFFSFERAGIVPDIIVMAKSISGYGLPMSIVLMKPELDIWKPGDHTGTFRGNQLAFIGATAALEYRENQRLQEQVEKNEEFLKVYLNHEIASISNKIEIRGIGMLWGIDMSKFADAKVAEKVAAKCYEHHLILERSGRSSSVIKIMPPLTIEMDLLKKGCDILKSIIYQVVSAEAK
jgi:diaminobutyrate-2-oxoglutarate transaminase